MRNLFRRFIAFLFSRTQIDETLETILGDFLDTVNKLQALALMHSEASEFHNERAAEELTISNEHRAKATKAEGIAAKIEKLVS